MGEVQVLGLEGSQRTQYPLTKEHTLNHTIIKEYTLNHSITKEYTLNHNIKAPIISGMFLSEALLGSLGLGFQA